MRKISHNKKEKGQGLVEYALILVLVAIVVIAALTLLGPTIGNIFSSVNSSLTTVGGGGGGGGGSCGVVHNVTCGPNWHFVCNNAAANSWSCLPD